MINQSQKVMTSVVNSQSVEDLCKKMSISLPKWIEQAELAQNRIFCAATIDTHCVGLLAMEFSTDSNAHIDWMVINDANHYQSITEKLLLFAEIYCYEQEYTSMTLETISPKIKNETPDRI